jgi:hypothetical protein
MSGCYQQNFRGLPEGLVRIDIRRIGHGGSSWPAPTNLGATPRQIRLLPIHLLVCRIVGNEPGPWGSCKICIFVLSVVSLDTCSKQVAAWIDQELTS